MDVLDRARRSRPRGLLVLIRREDPGGCWERFGPWWPLDEPLGMGGVRGQTGAVPDGEDRGGAAVVDVGRREIAEAAVMVRVVVPREQIAADAARVFERASSKKACNGSPAAAARWPETETDDSIAAAVRSLRHD